MTLTSDSNVSLCQPFQTKLFEDGVVIYLTDHGDTIQLDHISFCILESVAEQNSKLSVIIEHLKKSSENTINFSIAQIKPYVDALISQNLITVCTR